MRIHKNLREKVVGDGHITRDVAPSYFLEGLLYNVPNEKFRSSFQDCFVNAITWIRTEADKSKLICANEQYYLLSENSTHTSWTPANCDRFLQEAVALWNRW